MVNATPNGELAKKFREIIKNNPGPARIKVMEQGGRQVKFVLQKINPTKTRCCDNQACLTCKNGRGNGGECRRNNVGYKLRIPSPGV